MKRTIKRALTDAIFNYLITAPRSEALRKGKLKKKPPAMKDRRESNERQGND